LSECFSVPLSCPCSSIPPCQQHVTATRLSVRHVCESPLSAPASLRLDGEVWGLLRFRRGVDGESILALAKPSLNSSRREGAGERGDVSESSSSSELGIACGKGRRLLVGRDKGAWIVRECECAVWRVNRSVVLLSRMRWVLKNEIKNELNGRCQKKMKARCRMGSRRVTQVDRTTLYWSGAKTGYRTV